MKSADSETHIIYRPAVQDDCYRIAELDNIASGGTIDFLFHDLVPGMTPVQIIAANLRNEERPHSYRNVIVAEQHGEVVGMALFFPAKYHRITKEMDDFFPADRLAHFKHFFSSRVEGSFFLDAVCVDEGFRGKGIGSKLIDLAKDSAQQQGFHVLSLIVFADNAEAIQVYRKKGFEVVSNITLQAHPLMPHEGGCLLMKAEVNGG